MDSRGNLWHQCGISEEKQLSLNVIRKNWAVANDDAITSAKFMITSVFGDEGTRTRGMACEDFIYLFSHDNCSHYFVCTDPHKPARVLKYEGECDMTYAPGADFSLVLAQASVF